MENFEGLIGAIAVSGLRAGLDRDTTINLVVSLRQVLSRFGPIMRVRQLVQIANSFKASEDIGRVAAGVLRVSANSAEANRTIPADQDIGT